MCFFGGAEEGGHGTHVAGTLAGAQSGEDAGDDEGDGMAFQGKLAVFDFGDSDNSNVLSTPDEVGWVAEVLACLLRRVRCLSCARICPC